MLFFHSKKKDIHHAWNDEFLKKYKFRSFIIQSCLCTTREIASIIAFITTWGNDQWLVTYYLFISKWNLVGTRLPTLGTSRVMQTGHNF